MAKPSLVEFEGLAELRRDLAKIDKETMAKAMIEAGLAISEPAARAISAALPHRTGRLSGSVRASRIRTGAAVRTGTRAIPYAGPVEFGGYPGRRPYLPQGRYIFPTARGYAERAADKYVDEINKAINSFQWTKR